MALKKARRPGGGTRGRPEKTLELANNGLGKDETKTQKLWGESAYPILEKRESSVRPPPLSLSLSPLFFLLPFSAFVPHSQLSFRPIFNSVTL